MEWTETVKNYTILYKCSHTGQKINIPSSHLYLLSLLPYNIQPQHIEDWHSYSIILGASITVWDS